MVMKLIKLHFRYFLSRFNFIIISLIVTLIIFGFIISINPFISRTYQALEQVNFRELYFQNAFFIIKMALILLASLLIGNSFMTKNDNYNVIYFSYRQNRIRYFISKLLSMHLSFIAIGIIVYLFYLAIGYLLSPWFIWSLNESLVFLLIIFISMIYGSMSVIIVLLVDSAFALILPFLIFIIVELINDFGTKELIIIFNLLFPVISFENNHIILLYGIIHLGLVLILYSFLAQIIYLFKDFT